jgi:hypothetical protein
MSPPQSFSLESNSSVIVLVNEFALCYTEGRKFITVIVKVALTARRT